jgi:3-deoxy-7-phosphoheptulonate synthase
MNEFAARRTWGPTPKYERVKAYEPPKLSESEQNGSDREFFIISGPCSVETPEQIFEIAKIVACNGATYLRGGVYRAGTYPGANFGLVNTTLLSAYQAAAHSYGIENIIEVLDIRLIETLDKYADCFQVGCRQMQNYSLLRELAQSKKKVFLKRSPGATLDEFLGSAEHLLTGNCEPILIERGSSTHANHVRWDLSISMIPAIQQITKMPIICDASHGTGRRDLVTPMALAGVAAGADGLLIEVHTTPEKSLSDADQAITPSEFKSLMTKVNTIKELQLNGKL